MIERQTSVPKERTKAIVSGALVVASLGSFVADTLLASNLPETPLNRAASAAWPFFLYVGGPLFMFGAYHLTKALDKLDSVKRPRQPRP